MRLLLALMLATSLQAQDAAGIARLVNENSVDPAVLAKALQSSDALTRAAAARVAMVRDAREIMPALRAALEKESNADAAREEVRAIVLLGSDDDIAFAAGQLSRFPDAIDRAFAAALARLGAPRAVDLYLRHREALRGDPELPGVLPHWRDDQYVTASASRLFSARAVSAFAALLRALTDSQRTLDAKVAAAALGSTDAAIREAVLRHLLQRAAVSPESVSVAVREAADAPREGSSADENALRELLRRTGGAKAQTDPEMLAWLARNPHEPPAGTDWLLTKEEKAVVAEGRHAPPPARAQEVVQPNATLPLALPRGLAAAIFASTRCIGGWMGIGSFQADPAGRVLYLELQNIGIDRGCEETLRTIARLSLAQPRIIGAPAAERMLVVRARGAQLCFDEANVDEPLAAGPGMVPPKVQKRVEVRMPGSVLRRLQGMIMVTAEMTVTASGCVRDVRLVQQTPFPELNTAVLLAMSQWTFTPGTLDGVPTDVVYRITMSFRN